MNLPRLLLIGGGAGSGKTSLARAVAQQVPGTGVVHLDSCYHQDVALAPSVPRLDGVPGRIVDFSNPQALDPVRISAALDEHFGAPLTIVEGIFALALNRLVEKASWTVFVDVPADLRVVRKTIRNLTEGRDPLPGLLGYAHTVRAFDLYVAPTRQTAGLVLNGTLPIEDQAASLVKRLEL
ncbi:zeta toxin family protein [Streptomyces sp. NBC_00237]|uniref:uridine kinase family protein n=1 Tax=Streptomyces sp. NBC_00237 TaxID=2975687 RepID=UPI00225422D7|nr:zeta toxin family protein [Streptomyces sp. NBC_00237]MCX5205800.1 zeta toxin family protein [Streptomyces sp. NBC_00237]